MTSSINELESAQARDPKVNKLTAMIKTRRVPKRSASQPLTGISIATVSV